MKLFVIFDRLAGEPINCFAAPTESSAIVIFNNAKDDFVKKCFNPKLVDLYFVSDFDKDNNNILCSLDSSDGKVKDIVDSLMNDDEPFTSVDLES